MTNPERNHLRPFGTILGPTWPPRTPVYNFLDPECRNAPWVHRNRNAHAVKLYFMGKVK